MVFLAERTAHTEDLVVFDKRIESVGKLMDQKFGEQSVSLTFIESQLTTLRKDLEQVSKRTKEDDGAFVRDMLKLRNRVQAMEKELKKLKVRVA